MLRAEHTCIVLIIGAHNVLHSCDIKGGSTSNQEVAPFQLWGWGPRLACVPREFTWIEIMSSMSSKNKLARTQLRGAAMFSPITGEESSRGPLHLCGGGWKTHSGDVVLICLKLRMHSSWRSGERPCVRLLSLRVGLYGAEREWEHPF